MLDQMGNRISASLIVPRWPSIGHSRRFYLFCSGLNSLLTDWVCKRKSIGLDTWSVENSPLAVVLSSAAVFVCAVLILYRRFWEPRCWIVTHLCQHLLWATDGRRSTTCNRAPSHLGRSECEGKLDGTGP